MKKENQRNLNLEHIHGVRVLILGASGFIGKALSSTFNEYGALVTGTTTDDFDALSQHTSEYLSELVTNKDVIINLIGLKNSHASMSTQESRKINVEFCKTLLDTIGIYNPKAKVIFPSSQTIYGDIPNYERFTEEHVCNPVRIYAQEKKEAEDIHLNFVKKHPNQVVIFRLTNIYGPDKKNTQSIPTLFTLKAMANENITIYGDGKDMRDYIYVDDVARIFMYASITKLNHTIYNLCSGQLSSLNNIAENIVKRVGKGTIVHVPFPKEYTYHAGDIIIDNSRLLSEIQVGDFVRIEDGLERLYLEYNKS